MLQVGRYAFKRADSSSEFEQIHRLNHRTFVEEIGQHAATADGRLVDKFHDKNVYFIGLRGDQVVGMISVHDRPPFSVADRLSDPGILTRPGTRPLEVRLLAIDPAERHGPLFLGLGVAMLEHARAHGYTHLFISGVTDRLDLYQRVGFEPLGPARVAGGASFVPMGATLPAMQAKVDRLCSLWRNHIRRHSREPVCLLPGPVTVARRVRTAFQQPPIYHRGPAFLSLFQKVRRFLGEMVGGRDVALCNGSGTLANEAIAATLAIETHAGCRARPADYPGIPQSEFHGPRWPGLVLVNGEFGERLVKQVARFELEPHVLRWDWGQPWDLDEVDALLGRQPGGWVWGVHLESSTGVLNDLPGLVRVAKRHGTRVCADCISSLGAVPLDLRDVYLASGATGKSLGSYAGLAIVFADAAALAGLDTARVPGYLDVPATLASPGPRFTFPSPLLLALEAALSEYGDPARAQARFERYAALGAWIRRQLRELGMEPLAPEDHASPVITTWAPPEGERSTAFVARCRDWGYDIGGHSGYLAERNLVQIATMGAVSPEAVTPLFEHLRHWRAPASVLVG